MRVLIACEESQRVALEFRKMGHEAYSCDLEEAGGVPIVLSTGQCCFRD